MFRKFSLIGFQCFSSCIQDLLPHPHHLCPDDFVQVLKARKENKVTTLELSSTFLPQANRNKLLQYILSFTLLWPRQLLAQLRPQASSRKGLLLVTSKQSQVLFCGKLYQDVPSRNSRNLRAVSCKTLKARLPSLLRFTTLPYNWHDRHNWDNITREGSFKRYLQRNVLPVGVLPVKS